MAKGRTGASMVTRDGAARAKRRRKAREREEARWKALSGPLTITFDESVRRDVQATEVAPGP